MVIILIQGDKKNGKVSQPAKHGMVMMSYGWLGEKSIFKSTRIDRFAANGIFLECVALFIDSFWELFWPFRSIMGGLIARMGRHEWLPPSLVDRNRLHNIGEEVQAQLGGFA